MVRIWSYEQPQYIVRALECSLMKKYFWTFDTYVVPNMTSSKTKIAHNNGTLATIFSSC